MDATLTVAGGRGLRERVDELGKPLAGVLVTHSRPDHYGRLVELLRDAHPPVFASAGVIDVIGRDDSSVVFSGDQAYNGMHAYLADGFYEGWLEHIARLREELPADATLYPGHGAPGGLELLHRQAEYIETFVDAVRGADDAEVVDTMMRFLPADQLRFLMELSVEPLRTLRAR